jgi:hypothetical protein
MIILLSVLFSSFSLFAHNSYIPIGRILHEDGTQYSLRGEQWTSQSRFDSKGKEFSFEDGESFTRREVEFRFDYGLAKEIQFSAGAKYRQNISQDDVGGELFEVTSNGLQSVLAELVYSTPLSNRFQMAAYANYRYVPYTNEEFDINNTKTMILGDEGHELSGGASLTYTSFAGYSIGAKGMYRKPGKNLSQEILYQFEVAAPWESFAIVAGLEGIRSLNKDPYTVDPENKTPLNTGSTFMYNTVNRQFMAPYGGINVLFGKEWRVELRAQQVMSVQSYDSGSLYSITIAKRSEEKSTQIVDSQFKEYDLEANVTKISPKKIYMIIDKGLTSGVEKGTKFDLFHFDYLGGNVLLARASVIQVQADTSIIKITSRFSTKHEIKEGTLARAVIKEK